VGPYAIERGTVWFASTFYDGEGISGIGSIGRFDLAKKRYSMLWPPELAPWSGSALLLDGDDVWVGLMRRPEGAEYGAGLLRYNRKTGALTSWQFRDYVYTIHRSGDAVYCGTENGVWMVRDGQLTQLRFEPGETGRLTMVVR
jgi:hypothetical protein